jgi:simple sugar transport system permease protein
VPRSDAPSAWRSRRSLATKTAEEQPAAPPAAAGGPDGSASVTVLHAGPDEAASGASRLGQLALWTVRRAEFGAAVSFAGVLIFFAFFTMHSGFFTFSGIASWVNVAAELGIVAVPIGLLLIAGEFDLSIGAVVGAASIFTSVWATTEHWNFWLAAVVALAMSVVIGFVNGIILIKTRLPSFIVTLATWFTVAGLSLGVTQALTGTTSVSLTVTGAARVLFAGQMGQFNASVIWWLAITAVAVWVLGHTRFGNWILGTGGDVNVARAAGVPTDRVKLYLFITASSCAGILGILQAVEYQGGNLTNGSNLVFDTLIAVIIGGALFHGGYGSVLGLFLGTVTYGVVDIGIFYTGWNSDYAQLFLGILLLAAVLGNSRVRAAAMRVRRPPAKEGTAAQ